MKVLLLQNVNKLGNQYETKEVAGGYARNFLIPQGLAKILNQENLDWVVKKRITQEKKATEELKHIGKMASGIDGLEVELSVKVGDKGQLFEKINAKKITAKLKDLGYNINKDQVKLEKEIENLGEFEIKVKFDHDLESQIKVIVTEENNPSTNK